MTSFPMTLFEYTERLQTEIVELSVEILKKKKVQKNKVDSTAITKLTELQNESQRYVSLVLKKENDYCRKVNQGDCLDFNQKPKEEEEEEKSKEKVQFSKMTELEQAIFIQKELNDKRWEIHQLRSFIFPMGEYLLEFPLNRKWMLDSWNKFMNDLKQKSKEYQFLFLALTNSVLAST
jgi:hypothetical protein